MELYHLFTIHAFEIHMALWLSLGIVTLQIWCQAYFSLSLIPATE